MRPCATAHRFRGCDGHSTQDACLNASGNHRGELKRPVDGTTWPREMISTIYMYTRTLMQLLVIGHHALLFVKLQVAFRVGTHGEKGSGKPLPTDDNSELLL